MRVEDNPTGRGAPNNILSDVTADTGVARPPDTRLPDSGLHLSGGAGSLPVASRPINPDVLAAGDDPMSEPGGRLCSDEPKNGESNIYEHAKVVSTLNTSGASQVGIDPEYIRAEIDQHVLQAYEADFKLVRPMINHIQAQSVLPARGLTAVCEIARHEIMSEIGGEQAMCTHGFPMCGGRDPSEWIDLVDDTVRSKLLVHQLSLQKAEKKVLSLMRKHDHDFSQAEADMCPEVVAAMRHAGGWYERTQAYAKHTAACILHSMHAQAEHVGFVPPRDGEDIACTVQSVRSTSQP